MDHQEDIGALYFKGYVLSRSQFGSRSQLGSPVILGSNYFGPDVRLGNAAINEVAVYVIPEQFTVKAHPALFEEEGEGSEPKNEALLFQSTVDKHFQNAHKTSFQSTVDITFKTHSRT